MKIKLDENLPESLLEVLRGLGHDSYSVGGGLVIALDFVGEVAETIRA